MKYFSLFFISIGFYACWKPVNSHPVEQVPVQRVWGNRPIYTAVSTAKQVLYSHTKQPILHAGNIYAFEHFIFQIDVGRGIHIIDNSVPATADRIGFITMNGCEQISIKGNYLYTNSYGDLVTLGISDPLNMKEVNRIPNAFPELMYNYPLIQPEDTGYYTCPVNDSVVTGWVKDSINASCYKY